MLLNAMVSLLQEKPTISLIYKGWVGSNRHLWLLWECRYRQSLPAEYAAEEVALVEDQRRVEQYVASRYISPVRPCFCAALRRAPPRPMSLAGLGWRADASHPDQTNGGGSVHIRGFGVIGRSDRLLLDMQPSVPAKAMPLLLDPHPEQAGRLLR